MKVRKPARIFTIALAMLLALSLCACTSSGTSTTSASSAGSSSVEASGSGGDATADTSTLSYPTKKPEEYSGELDYWVWGEYESRCTDPFFEMYPGIKINFVTIPTGEFFTKLQTAIAAQTDLPDIGNLEQTPRRTWFNLDCWERLDAAPYNMDTSVLVDWSLPLMTNERGEVVCAQIDNCIGGITYNRKLANEL